MSAADWSGMGVGVRGFWAASPNPIPFFPFCAFWIFLLPFVWNLRESETTIKIKFALFRGGLGRGAGRKIVQNAVFHGNVMTIKF